MEKTISTTIVNLKFISQLNNGDKIDLNTMTKQSSGLFTSIYRTFSDQDRIKTYDFLDLTIKNVFDIIVYLKNSNRESDKRTYKQILQDLDACLIGLNNIKTTYENDLQFVCKIDTLLQIIESKLQDIKHESISESYLIKESENENSSHCKEVSVSPPPPPPPISTIDQSTIDPSTRPSPPPCPPPPLSPELKPTHSFKYDNNLKHINNVHNVHNVPNIPIISIKQPRSKKRNRQ